ncbi:MAG: transcription antitermination factor NusB, partial [Polyangiales bacterium]
MSTRAPRTTRTADARQRAAEVLARVEADRAFAAAALDAALDRAPALDPRDRGFATELVYGALRSLGALDAALGRHARDGVRSILKLDPWTRAVLRVAAYQILALDRVPPRAAVSAAVDAIRAQRSAGLAGFANAVLRKVAADRPDPMPPDARVELAMRAVPDEVFSRITPLLGDDGARAHLRAA